jgi:hypothetical protein
VEPLQVLQAVVSTLDRLGIASLLVGSFASSSHGFPRLTRDADLVVQLDQGQVDGFIAAFSREFYLDRGLIDQAIANQSSFNLIHFETAFKIDFFVLRIGGYVEEEFSRGVPKRIDLRTGFAPKVQTPEDSILSKLVWYRQGGEVSENQWRDVIGVLKVQAERLDVGYLQRWAEELGITDLLLRARQEAAR